MSGNGNPRLMLSLVLGTAVTVGVYWAFFKSHQTAPTLPEPTKAVSAPEREALDAAEQMNDLKKLKSAVGVMQKKNEVRTAVDTAMMSRGLSVDDAAFEAAWNRIPTSERSDKSPEALAEIIAASLKP